MNPAETVRIVYPENKRAGYANIALADYDPKIHTIWDDRLKLSAAQNRAKADSDLAENIVRITSEASGRVMGATSATMTGEVISQPQVSFTIAKGPRGLWFVKDAAGKTASPGFTSEDDAAAELARMSAA